ncbi:MAG: phosphodiester glycosidase family protein [Turicibacter sp.]|nr:phosphodiester glycosidase family protein [Turicibacter sp.]
MKKIVFIALLLLFFPINAQAQLIFEHREQTFLSRDVIYELNRQITTDGFLDIHVLRVPLNDPFIEILPIESARELGLRETTYNLLQSAGAIAGTNADFFGLTGTHSLAFGPVIANGTLQSITSSYNVNSNQFATFFLDSLNTPFFNYIRPTIVFDMGGIVNIPVISVNKVNNIFHPVIITPDAMNFTGPLLARFPNLMTLLVVDERVTMVTNQAVFIPPNGFALVMDSESLFHHAPNPHNLIGLRATFFVYIAELSSRGLGISDLRMAVGGGGLILQNGQIVHDTGTAIAGRHPRTALGITADFQHMILMVVDGRGRSIGATHEELAALLLRYGVTNAMHLDGGGSSTMVARSAGPGTALQLQNTVSDGSQRAVMNAIGIFDRSTPTAASRLTFANNATTILRGAPLFVNVYATDAYLHRIWINPAEIELTAFTPGLDGNYQLAAGFWSNTIFVPENSGILRIQARYGELVAIETFIVQDYEEIDFFDPIRVPMSNVIPGFAHDFSLPMLGSGALQYSFRQENTAAILQMSAANGGLYATNRSQWRFINDINSINPNFVIIRMDENPLTALNADEFNLFHGALANQQAMGRMVFVISNTAESPALNIRDGIRYIDLGRAGENTDILFRIIDGQIWYDF